MNPRGPAVTDRGARELDSTVVRYCDESKCVSRGMSNFYNGSFTCYGDDGSFYPMMCADGFLPVMVDDEPFNAVVDENGGGKISVGYFTCCPPYESNEPYDLVLLTSNSTDAYNATDVTRRCSDPITVPIDSKLDDYESTDNICDDQDIRKYPRTMQSSAQNVKHKSVICCDSDVTPDDYSDDYMTGDIISRNFLDDVECVPYHNEFFYASKAQNRIGRLGVISCDVAEGEFRFPQPLDEGTNDSVSSSVGKYQCCKHGPGMPPFVHDSAFQITVYPVLVLFCIASVASVIVIISLLIPLLVELKDSRKTRAESQPRVEKRRYSTYNLYLVYLAFIDLIYSLFVIGLIGGYASQKFNPDFYTLMVSEPNSPYDSIGFTELIIFPYGSANMWISAILCKQVLVVLEAEKRKQEIQQPSLTKVNVQAGTVCFLTAVYAFLMFFFVRSNRNFWNSPILFIILTIFVGLMIVPPFIYIVNNIFFIWRRGYIPSTNIISERGKQLRELGICYFCIVAIFIVMWITCGALGIYAVKSGESWVLVLTMCLTAIESILSTCVILTNSDARRYILKLVTLSYLVRKCKCRKDKVVSSGEDDNTTERRPTSKTFHVSRPTLASRAETKDNNVNAAKADAHAWAFLHASGRSKPRMVLFTGETVTVDPSQMRRISHLAHPAV